jgi:hypothetical protein
MIKGETFTCTSIPLRTPTRRQHCRRERCAIAETLAVKVAPEKDLDFHRAKQTLLFTQVYG